MYKSKTLGFLRILGATSAVVLSVGTGLAYASVDVSSINDITGPSSDNISIEHANQDLNLDVQNSSDVFNHVNPFIETGNTDTSRNTVVGSLRTGDASVDVSFDSLANGVAGTNLGVVGLGNLANNVSFSGSNRITGFNSINRNEINTDRNINIDVNNNSHVSNRIDFNANTGNNLISRNTEVGDISTGAVDLTSHITNTGTSTAPVLDLSGLNTGTVSATFENGTTGPSSDNINSIEANSTVNADITNRSEINNDFSVDATTGNNSVGENTVVGNVSTGNVSVSLSGTN